MPAHNAVRIYAQMRTALKRSHAGMSNEKLDATALALTQSTLLAEAIGNLGNIGPAIESALRDVGPLISAAVDNVSERLASLS